MGNIIKRPIISFLLLSSLIIPLNLKAQSMQAVEDKQKYKQLNSMENGGWDFAPDYWYWLLHKNYSGAEIYWTMELGFIPLPHVRFKEENSNVMRTYISRSLQVPEVLENKIKTKTELDTITPIFNEESARYLDRAFDISYSQYKDDFNKLQATIAECLDYCMEKSNGRLSEAVDIIKHSNEMILDEIAYIHKDTTDGLEGYELENSKRQIAYDEALEKMGELKRISLNLYAYAKVHY